MSVRCILEWVPSYSYSRMVQSFCLPKKESTKAIHWVQSCFQSPSIRHCLTYRLITLVCKFWHTWMMCFLVGPASSVLSAFDQLKPAFQKIGLDIQEQKCELYNPTPSEDMSVKPTIPVTSEGMKILGVPIGRKEFISQVCVDIVQDGANLCHQLVSLDSVRQIPKPCSCPWATKCQCFSCQSQPWVSVFTAPYMYVRRYVLHCIYSVLLNWVYSKAWRANKTGTSLVCI